MTFQALMLWLAAANIAAFLAFGLDKRLAQNGSHRIAESTLLGLALVGGSIGAVGGQQVFRHKTRKEPFRSTLHRIFLLQMAGLFIWLVKPDLLSALAG